MTCGDILGEILRDYWYRVR